MAEQYVERRPGRPWLAWIIILIIVAFIVWLFVAFWGRGANQTAVNAPVNPNAPLTGGAANAPGPGAPYGGAAGNAASSNDKVVTDPGDLAGASNQRDYIGREVRFDDVQVKDQAGKGFWISSGSHRIFVLPVEAGSTTGAGNTSGTGMPNLRSGAKVSIRGVVERVPSANDLRQNWGLNSQQAAEVSGQQVYIRALSLAPAGSDHNRERGEEGSNK